MSYLPHLPRFNPESPRTDAPGHPGSLPHTRYIAMHSYKKTRSRLRGHADAGTG